MDVKCNGCGYVGDESTFEVGRDLFQNKFVAGCPKCKNRQSPGDASMRMFGGQRPFEYVREKISGNPLAVTLHNASEAA
jgi:hypothetical protein